MLCNALKRTISTDNEAQGQSAKLVDANGLILCLLGMRGCVIFTMFRRMVEILKIDVNKLQFACCTPSVGLYARSPKIRQIDLRASLSVGIVVKNHQGSHQDVPT